MADEAKAGHADATITPLALISSLVCQHLLVYIPACLGPSIMFNKGVRQHCCSAVLRHCGFQLMAPVHSMNDLLFGETNIDALHGSDDSCVALENATHGMYKAGRG